MGAAREAAKENENATQMFEVYMIIATNGLYQGAIVARSNSDPSPSNDGTTHQLDVVIERERCDTLYFIKCIIY